MPEKRSRVILPEPPDELKHLSGRLLARIRQTIETSGPIPFSEYMEAALYEPGLGYYSAGLRKFGEGGDFVTAPELGGVFAHCLAQQVRETAAVLGGYSILEIGAGNGNLAADLLANLSDRPATHYRILERSAHLRQVQRETIERRIPGQLARVEWLDAPPDDAWRGVLIANEVIDALPVERFHLARSGLEQMFVTHTDDGLDWLAMPATDALSSGLSNALGPGLFDLQEGYCSEFNSHLAAWVASVTGSLEQGCALFIDYGYPRREYYLPERRSGTLICHYRHRANADPFRWPGLQDISAFVDFTALAEAGRSAGLECAGYTNQAMFLFGCGLADLVADTLDLPDRERLQIADEIRQLTMPGAMGEKFQVMALSRGFEAPLRGFSQLDLRYRL